MQFKKVGVASDHAGQELRQMILDYLRSSGRETIDFGVDVRYDTAVDYPDYAALLAEAVLSGEINGAIAICGTGLGMAITGNKFRGIRACCIWDEYSSRMSRQHNNSNMLCLGSRTLNPYRAIDLVGIWLETSFSGERHQLRLDKIQEIEKRNFQPQ
ncbi:MAG: ribose 5-phosphate isomerase B [Deltaproteobacteria bacterium]|nr:ribose 5-phosphate isomerase B [Deltaproteobacteria bacterium]